MMNLCMISMNSISTLIAEDSGAPELRNPLAGVRKKNLKRGLRKQPTGSITRWSLIEKMFSRSAMA